MEFYERSREDEIEFSRFTEKVDNIYNNLRKYEGEIDLFDISLIKKNFITKTNDFFRDDRKLNIGIIGRVKVGKSTFLNDLLFEGKSILPTAVTPKTAALTRIEYDDDNRIEVEYFTRDEWRIITSKAEEDIDTGEYVVAKEIVSMLKERDIVPEDYIARGHSTIRYNSSEALMKDLNEYVGENGKFTPIVKSVSIFVDNEELDEISIVDTPGLYDPVLSRVDKTKQFMELCDVVFFLSKSTSFLDKNDIDLMASQLPKKGVKKVILVCSRFDDGIRDTLWNCESLDQAIEQTRSKLTHYAQQAFINYRNVNAYVNNDVIEQFKHPIFISSMVDGMLKKDSSEYTSKEKKVYDDLCIKGEATREQLEKISNMQQLKKIFDEVVEEKEHVLEEKAKTFIPVAKEELNDKLSRIMALATKRKEQLAVNDKEKLSAHKKAISIQINKMNANLEIVFNDLIKKVEEHKIQAISEIRAYNREYLQVPEKEGVTTHFEIKKESSAVWFKPWTWGTSSRVIYSYDEKYQYIDAYDAVENIRNFVEDGKESIERAFNKSIDIAEMKHKLLSIIVENLSTLGDEYDGSYYRLLVEKTLQEIKIPQIEFPTTQFEEMITSEFSGEIKSNSMKSNFKKVLSDAIYDVREGICKKLESEVMRFEDGLEELKNSFANTLLADIKRELDTIIQQSSDKENKIKVYTEIIDIIEKIDA